MKPESYKLSISLFNKSCEMKFNILETLSIKNGLIILKTTMLLQTCYRFSPSK